MLAQLLELIDANPSSLNYSRGRGGLPPRVQMFFDDTAKDRRTIVEYELGRPLSLKVTRLAGYNPEKHVWTDYRGERRYELPNRRGEKRLTAKLCEISKALTRWENCSFTRYADGRVYADGSHGEWTPATPTRFDVLDKFLTALANVETY